MKPVPPFCSNAFAGAVCGVAWLSLLPASTASQQQATYRPLDAVLRIDKPRLTIGSADRDGPDLFGRIVGVTMDNARNVYVLDGTDHSVRVFSPAGRHIASVGRPGRGPGDLRDPITLWHDGIRSLFVVDRFDGISVFTTSGGTITYRTRIGADLRPTAVCGLGGELFVAGLRDGRILHVLSSDGAVTRSFGERFRRDTIPGIQDTYDTAELKLACDEEGGRVFVAEGAQALVRAYGTDGRLRWQVELPEYDGYRVGINRNPPGIAVFWGKFLTKTVTRIGPDLLIVQANHQTSRRDPRRGGALATTDHGVVTWVLSASTGTVLTRQYGGPFLSMARGGEAVGYEPEPFPRAYLLRVTPR